MSFSGKKYRRTHCVNINEMVKTTNASPQTINMLCSKSAAPVFSFIRLDERTFIFKLILQEKVMSQKFRLGEEFVMERNNGSKVRVTYTLDGEDVLSQVIKHPDGRMTFFRREFGTSNKMIITSEAMAKPAIVYYEQIN